MSTATESVKDQTLQDQEDIRALIDRVHRAHHDKDAAAIAAPFAADALIFNLAPPLAHHGVNVQEKQAWLDSWDGPVEITPRDFEITVSGDLAFCHGYLHMRGNKKEGVEVSFWMRETVCLKRLRGSWTIVHEHASVPFYMDGSLRPAFDLQP
jgi:ketosteroid isomerase-like protein